MCTPASLQQCPCQGRAVVCAAYWLPFVVHDQQAVAAVYGLLAGFTRACLDAPDSRGPPSLHGCGAEPLSDRPLLLEAPTWVQAHDREHLLVQPLRSSSRSLDAALLRSLGSRRIGRAGSEGEALPEALTKPPSSKEDSEQNREEMREKLRIVKARCRLLPGLPAVAVGGVLPGCLHAALVALRMWQVLPQADCPVSLGLSSAGSRSTCDSTRNLDLLVQHGPDAAQCSCRPCWSRAAGSLRGSTARSR